MILFKKKSQMIFVIAVPAFVFAVLVFRYSAKAFRIIIEFIL